MFFDQIEQLVGVEQIHLISPIPEIDLVVVKITEDKFFWITIINLYIPPTCLINDYAEIFDYIEYTVDFTHPVLILGDFNIPELNECTLGNRTTGFYNTYNNFITLNDLKQSNAIVNVNNRLLDLVLSNNQLNTEVIREPLPLLQEDVHHPCLRIFIESVKPNNTFFEGNGHNIRFNFKKANFPQLYAEIAAIDWTVINNIDNVNLACDYLYDTLYKIFSKHVRTCKFSNLTDTYPVWFTKTIINNIKLKKHYWNEYRKTKSPHILENLRCLRQQIERDIRNNYDIFLRNTQNSILNDPKTFWSFVNSKKRTTSIPGVVVHEDQEFSSSQAIVNVFAQFFAGVYVKHVCEDVCVSKDDCGGVNMMHNFKIDEDMIVRAGKKLKSNSVSGPDNIPAFIVVDCVAQGSNLGPLLFILFFNDVLDNISSHAYLYADDKKIAKVINSYDDCLELQQDLDNFIYW
ncbi:uncharacterized protein LOC135121766, partial [Zophobas morio]|uniref:uncharacterized protein LOC135121766 n=1 Tax=Zophobas morio TaxID=2755281 RepID=UPI003083C50A